jgi:hypothetical protein
MTRLTETLLKERPVYRHKKFLVAQSLSLSKVHLHVTRGRAGVKARNSENNVGVYFRSIYFIPYDI